MIFLLAVFSTFSYALETTLATTTTVIIREQPTAISSGSPTNIINFFLDLNSKYSNGILYNNITIRNDGGFINDEIGIELKLFDSKNNEIKGFYEKFYIAIPFPSETINIQKNKQISLIEDNYYIEAKIFYDGTEVKPYNKTIYSSFLVTKYLFSILETEGKPPTENILLIILLSTILLTILFKLFG